MRLGVCSIFGDEALHPDLTEYERAGLEDIVRRNRMSKLKLQRAQILQKADVGLTDVDCRRSRGRNRDRRA